MSWPWIIGFIALVTLFYAAKKSAERRQDPSREEIAKTIKEFLEGSGGPYDWDHFVSIPLNTPELEKIRKECFEIHYTYRSKKKNEWCSDDGIAQLRRIYERLNKNA